MPCTHYQTEAEQRHCLWCASRAAREAGDEDRAIALERDAREYDEHHGLWGEVDDEECEDDAPRCESCNDWLTGPGSLCEACDLW